MKNRFDLKWFHSDYTENKTKLPEDRYQLILHDLQNNTYNTFTLLDFKFHFILGNIKMVKDDYLQHYQTLYYIKSYDTLEDVCNDLKYITEECNKYCVLDELSS